MKNDRKQSIIFILILAISCLGLGYAYLTTTLSINGTSDIDSASWNVYWDNVEVSPTPLTSEQIIQPPTIDASKKNVNFHIRFSEPGVAYSFTIDAVNDGTIDAMIESITTTVNGNPINTIPNYLIFEVRYKTGLDIEVNQALYAGDRIKYEVFVGYICDDSSCLSATPQSFDFSFSVNYVQADENAVTVQRSFYNISNRNITIGNGMPSNITFYNSYQEAIAEFGNPFFLKHTVVEDIIKETSIGFVINDNLYYILSSNTNNYYDHNKGVLKSAFGEENCTETSNYYYCFDGNASIRIEAEALNNGRAYVFSYETSVHCTIDGSTSSCGSSVG